jgi:hypothetical protein
MIFIHALVQMIKILEENQIPECYLGLKRNGTLICKKAI